MFITCDCGNVAIFIKEDEESRSFFDATETVEVGSVDGFTFDIHSPVATQIELYCKECGKVYRNIDKNRSTQ